MGKSKIEWTEKTWNPVTGCDKVSAGCKNCYAIQNSWIRQHSPNAGVAEKYAGVVEKSDFTGKLKWTGRINTHEESLKYPFTFKKPTTFFVNSMSDLFHDHVPMGFIAQVMQVIFLTPQHTYQVLTKRPENFSTFVRFMEKQSWNQTWAFPKNLWLGVSVEDQKAANERIPYLLETYAHIRFISCEPLLGPVDLENVFQGQLQRSVLSGNMKHVLAGWSCDTHKIDWVIAGGESGPDARPMHPAWAENLRDQCAKTGTAFFFKQWGNWVPGETGRYVDGGYGENMAVMTRVTKKQAGSILDGKEYKEYPVKP